MKGFWGLWRNSRSDNLDKDLVRMGQGLFTSDKIIHLQSAGILGMATVNDQAGAAPAMLSQITENVWFVGAARLDNRDALFDKLGLMPSPAHSLSDVQLVGHAYLRWGEECVDLLMGDWAFAAGDPVSGHLFLARDQFGITSVYYSVNSDFFAFASKRSLLLNLSQGMAEVDDLYLARLLLSWKVYEGESTPHKSIRRLPPGHTLTVSHVGEAVVRAYGSFDCAAEGGRIIRLSQAAETARFYFDAAVRSRIRTGEQIATALSGGLDSSSVTLAAASMSLAASQAVHSYTAVPVGNVLQARNWFGDEWSLAAAVASQASNIVHRAVRSASTTPLDGIRESLWIHDGPVHAAGNAFWIHDMMRMARADNCQVLLSGDMGNLGISWTGFDLRQGWDASAAWLRGIVSKSAKRFIKRRRFLQDILHGVNTALHMDLARRVNVIEASRDDPHHPLNYPDETPLQRRVRMLGAGRTIVGCLLAEHGQAFGLEIRDPTADVRLLTYCLSVPPHLFVDPQTGMDRMVMRAAMAGRLPDEVRLNRRRGLQAADIIPRLRADRDAMEACLDELERGDAIHYVNLPRMRQVWRAVLVRDDRDTHIAAKAVLLRGIMVGLFVQNPAGGPRPNLERTLPAADREIP